MNYRSENILNLQIIAFKKSNNCKISHLKTKYCCKISHFTKKISVPLQRLKILDMIDKRTLEFILTDQQEELESRADETLCDRMEEKEIDLKSPQAQVVIGVRRSGKSTLCYQALQRNDLKYAYVDFDDERLATLETQRRIRGAV